MNLPKNCCSCGSKFNIFRWRHTCCHCNKIFCSSCTHGFDHYKNYVGNNPVLKYLGKNLCFDCWKEVFEGFHNKYYDSCAKANGIQCYPINYKGKVDVDKNIPCLRIVTPYNKNRDTSLFQLKVTALVDGYDVICDYYPEKKTNSEPSENGKGIHYYNTWSATGVAYKKKKMR